MQARENFSILLVDDDPTVVRILSRMLSGFTPVRFATSGSVALKLARESIPDLVLLDIEMPEVSGFEVCKAFKSDQALAQVPVIFITSHESAQLETVGLQLGATDFISKPPHEPLVLARVRTYQRIKTLSDTMRTSATMDFLTGAITRRQLEKTLIQEWLRSQRSGAPLALLLADIDAFTAYNAEFGEEQGDICLRSVADALRSAVPRLTDVLGRYGGGKFALLLPETDLAGATVVAQRAIDAVRDSQPPISAATGKAHFEISVGGGCHSFSTYAAPGTATQRPGQRPESRAVPNDLFVAAEEALDASKAGGDRQVRFVDATSSQPGLQ